MRVIDLESWPRREHFHLFSEMEFPHVSLCVQVDITDLWANRARADASPTIGLAYVLTKAANRVPELRQRIRGGQVVEHDVVHPLITVLGGDDVFGLCPLAYDPCFKTFAANAGECIAKAKECPSLTGWPHDREGKPDRDDLLSITVIPWLSFTAFSITRRPLVDSIPLLAYGKVLKEGGSNRLPVSINFHHALVDGLHIARYVEHIEEEARALACGFG